MKAKRIKGICLFASLAVVVTVLVCGLYWTWKYYGLPEWPDRHEYKTIEERAEKALAFAKRHNMNEHYALFVDYNIPSGIPRLFAWDFHKRRIVTSTYVMHGPGGEVPQKNQYSVIHLEANVLHWDDSLLLKNMVTVSSAVFDLREWIGIIRHLTQEV